MPAIRSGAPHSSVATWALAVQMTASHGRSTDASATTLAPVPPNVKNDRASASNTELTRAPARAVHGSSP